MVVLLAVGAVL